MPAKMTVQATVPEKKDAAGKVVQAKVGPFIVSVDSGANASEMVKMFGEEAVKSNAEGNWTVTIQAAMRSGMKKGETQAQLQARLGGAKMGVAVRGAKVDPVQAYLAEFANATPENQAKMIAELTKKAAKPVA